MCVFKTSKLLHASWDRWIIREFCEICYVPSIFDSLELNAEGTLKANKQYVEGKKKAEDMFNEIMSSPEKIKKIVDSYIESAEY